MSAIPVLDHDAVLAAVSPGEAIDAVHAAFLAHHRGEWSMPAKVYLESPPHGDFRAMPALGDGVALLKWISSFPQNPAAGLPAVQGVVLLSDAETSAPLMLLDARAVTALRTGAVAAVAARALAPEGAVTVGVVGAGLHGAWVARCMAAAGYGPGVACDPRPEAAAAVVAEHGGGWRTGDRLACDEWAQASHGGELTAAVEAGRVGREDVVDLGAVLAGEREGRRGPEETTLFDSTGLAVQDLAIALRALEAWRAGRIDAGHARF